MNHTRWLLLLATAPLCRPPQAKRALGRDACRRNVTRGRSRGGYVRPRPPAHKRGEESMSTMHCAGMHLLMWVDVRCTLRCPYQRVRVQLSLSQADVSSECRVPPHVSSVFQTPGHARVARAVWLCVRTSHAKLAAYSGPSSIASEGRLMPATCMLAQARAGHAASHSADGSGGVRYRRGQQLRQLQP